jgi:4-azaleucine resistance transporter AzlC
MTPDTISTPSVVFTARGVREGLLRFLPLTPFVVPYGLAFGVAAVAEGFSPQAAIAMSVFVFAGASQFAALEIWAEPVPWLAIAALALTINARFLVMGASLAEWANALPLGRRLAALFLLADANFADARARLRAGERDLGQLLGGGLAMWGPWTIGTVLGATLGPALGALDRYGIDVVMLCFFTAVATAGLKVPVNRLPALVGAAVGVATLDILPPGWSVIAGALAGGVVAALRDER